MPNQIPENWKLKLREYSQEHFDEERDYLEAGDFKVNQSVSLKFPDDSTMFLRHAFYIHDKENEEIAVFSEHCGYFYFKTYDLEFEMLEGENPDAV